MTFCSRRSLGLFILLSAIPIAIYFSSSFQTPPSSYVYSGQGHFRECAKWDPDGLRFFASTMLSGSVVEIKPGEAEEKVVIKDADVAGNSSAGILVDRIRDRLLVVYGDAFTSRYSAVGAYRLDSWERIFLTRLSGADDEPSFADDVAIDPQGNAYITDAKSNKLYIVDTNGKLVSTIRNDLFNIEEWHKYVYGLNGIVYHPNGYLLVIHTFGGRLFKVSTFNDEVSVVNVDGSLLLGDGLEMLSSGKVVVAGVTGVKLVESEDDWGSGRVSGVWKGRFWMFPSSATEKNGRVYVNHLFGWGVRRQRHIIAEAVFTPVDYK